MLAILYGLAMILNMVMVIVVPTIEGIVRSGFFAIIMAILYVGESINNRLNELEVEVFDEEED